MPDNQHRVELTFDDGVYARLICPEGGCEPPSACGECGTELGADPSDRCEVCPDPTDECWVKTWFDALSADELIAGTVTVTIEPEWDLDTLTARIVDPEATA